MAGGREEGGASDERRAWTDVVAMRRDLHRATEHQRATNREGVKYGLFDAPPLHHWYALQGGEFFASFLASFKLNKVLVDSVSLKPSRNVRTIEEPRKERVITRIWQRPVSGAKKHALKISEPYQLPRWEFSGRTLGYFFAPFLRCR